MDSLVLCDYCHHGASLHAGDGCSALRCRCSYNRETVVADALALARREITEAYSPGAKS